MKLINNVFFVISEIRLVRSQFKILELLLSEELMETFTLLWDYHCIDYVWNLFDYSIFISDAHRFLPINFKNDTKN